MTPIPSLQLHLPATLAGAVAPALPGAAAEELARDGGFIAKTKQKAAN